MIAAAKPRSSQKSRKRTLDYTRRHVVVALLAAGRSRAQAAKYVRISPEMLQRVAECNSRFRYDMQKAELDYQTRKAHRRLKRSLVAHELRDATDDLKAAQAEAAARARAEAEQAAAVAKERAERIKPSLQSDVQAWLNVNPEGRSIFHGREEMPSLAELETLAKSFPPLPPLPEFDLPKVLFELAKVDFEPYSASDQFRIPSSEFLICSCPEPIDPNRATQIGEGSRLLQPDEPSRDENSPAFSREPEAPSPTFDSSYIEVPENKAPLTRVRAHKTWQYFESRRKYRRVRLVATSKQRPINQRLRNAPNPERPEIKTVVIAATPKLDRGGIAKSSLGIAPLCYQLPATHGQQPCPTAAQARRERCVAAAGRWANLTCKWTLKGDADILKRRCLNFFGRYGHRVAMSKRPKSPAPRSRWLLPSVLIVLLAVLAATRILRPRTSPDELIGSAIRLVEIGQPEKAVDLLDQALAIDPHHPDALLYRAQMARDDGELQTALDYLMQFPDEESEQATAARLMQAQIFLKLNRAAFAEGALLDVVTRAPKSVVAFEHLLLLYARQLRTEEIRSVLWEIRRLRPWKLDELTTYVLAGRAVLPEGECLPYILKYLEADPNDLQSRLAAARYYVLDGDHDKAIAVLQASADSLRNPLCAAVLAECHINEQRLDLAREVLTKLTADQHWTVARSMGLLCVSEERGFASADRGT